MDNKGKTRGITEDDFFSGIFAIFSLRDYKIVLLNKAFEKATAEVFQEFMEYAKQKGVELSFRIRPYPFHDDSETVQRGVLNAVQRGVLSLDGPENRIIRVKLTKDMANAILDKMTEGKLFRGFAERIIYIFSN